MASTESTGTHYIPKYHIRKMVENDVEEVLEIWKDNDLHEGTHTIQSFMKVDSDGLIVAVNDDDGQILGMCAGIFVNPDTAFIGLYGVRPNYQKLGIGITLWNKMMEHIGTENAGLYAVPQHLTMYRDRAGFPHRDSRMLLIYCSDRIRTIDLVKHIRGISVEPIDRDILQRIIDYDTKVHGYSREKLLPHTLAESDTCAMCAVDDTDKSIVGYGCFRTNNVGKAMGGPLYADNDAVAELLVYEIIKEFPIAHQNGLLYMTLDSNPGGITIAEKLGLHKHEEVPRFFNKWVYTSADWDRIYCIHSPNFSLF